MKSPLLLLAATVGFAHGQGFVCDIPTHGCTNGMFNQAMCECECLPPFCPDVHGDCTDPSDNCGGNKWTRCTRGVNCPWWVNPMKAESCTTGPEVPLGLWQIYNTREACCNTNFAYSNFCDEKLENDQPTKHPTIAAPEDDLYEVVPIKFDVSGLPDTISMRDLKDEMRIVLKRILIRLAKSIPGLKISSVEEKVVLTRNLENVPRALEQDVTLYFNVYVVRDDDKKFGPLIITEIRDSYDEVLDQIQTFADTKYFGAELNMNWCTSQDGKFEFCVKDINKKPTISVPARAPTQVVPPAVIQSDDEGQGVLPAWAIVLIVLIVLLLLCCIGYFIFASGRGTHDSKEVHNNIYMDENRSRGASRYGRSQGNNDTYFVNEKSHASRSRQTRRKSHTHRPRHSDDDENDEVQIVLAEPQDPQFDDSFTVNTYGTKKTNRLGRDPSMYIPGQEDRPDPVASIEDGESSRMYYQEDPPLKPKRDPTMYVDGQQDASMYGEEDYYSEDPPLKPKRDPTMYMNGQQDATMYVDGELADEYSVDRGTSVGGYSGDPYGMGKDIDEEEEYDPYGFKQSEVDADYNMTSEVNTEYTRGTRDPSYYVEDESGYSHEPRSVAKSSKTKKSKKSKKSSRR